MWPFSKIRRLESGLDRAKENNNKLQRNTAYWKAQADSAKSKVNELTKIKDEYGKMKLHQGALVVIDLRAGKNKRIRWFTYDNKSQDFVGDCTPHGFDTWEEAEANARKYWGNRIVSLGRNWHHLRRDNIEA